MTAMKTVRDYEEWNEEAESLMLFRESEREDYFRSVTSEDYGTACGILRGTFSSGVYSIPTLYSGSREILGLSRGLCVPASGMADLSESSFVVSGMSGCEMSSFFTGMDVLGAGGTVAEVGISDAFRKAALRFSSWFLGLGRARKERTLRDAFRLVSRRGRTRKSADSAINHRLAGAACYVLLGLVRDGAESSPAGGWDADLVGSFAYLLDEEGRVNSDLELAGEVRNVLFVSPAYPSLSSLDGADEGSWSKFVDSLEPHFGPDVKGVLTLE